MTEAFAPGALDGVKVLEIARARAIPSAGVLRADMGADVVKIEPPAGDGVRHTMEPILPGESKGYTLVNRGKRAICLDVTRALRRAFLLKPGLRPRARHRRLRWARCRAHRSARAAGTARGGRHGKGLRHA